MIQTHIMMGIEMSIMTAHTRLWVDMGAEITMTTEAAETMTEAMILGQTVAEEHLVGGTIEVMTTEERSTL